MDSGGSMQRSYGPLGAAVVASGAFVLALAHTDGRALVVLSDLGLVAASGAAALACAARARRSEARSTWRLTALACTAWATGQVVWTWSELVGGRTPPFQSLPDVGHIGLLPLFVAAALALPGGSRADRWRGLGDTVTVAVASLTASWSLVGVTLAGDGISAADVVAFGYPVTFLCATGVFLLTIGRRPQAETPSFLVVGAGGLVLGLVTIARSRAMVEGRYESGSLLDAGYLLGFALLVAAAFMPPHGAGRSRRCEAILIVAAHLPLAAALVAPLLLPPAGGLDVTGRVLAIAAITLVIARQHRLLLDDRMLAADLEERVAARTAELTASEARLRLAARSGTVGMWDWDPATDEVSWSPELRRILGEPDDVPATYERWVELVHPDDRHLLVDTERSTDVEVPLRVVRADGSLRHLVSRFSRHASVDGRYVGVILDVTELREADARVVETLESISDAYCALDREWRFTFVNRRAEELLGVSRRQLLGRKVWDVQPGTLGTRIETALRAAIASGRMYELETWFEPHQRWYAGRIYPYDNGLAVHFSDVNDRHRAEQERARLADALAHQATHDPLTGLANRPALAAAVADVLVEEPARAVHVLFIDLDRFKLVNDSLGHAAGDRLLAHVATRLLDVVRPGDVVARIGGDEFVIALVDVDDAGAERVADRILATLRVPIELDGQRLFVSASIGVAASEASPWATIDTLLRDADVALYRAKDAGRDQVAWFDEQARDESVERLQLEVELREGIAAGQLVLHYQPTYDLVSGETAGAEALVRWRHPRRGLVPPGAFVSIAEESGLIAELGAWALAEACREARRWADAGSPCTVWVNVSARQLARPGLAEVVRSCLDAAGLPAALLGVEVTESVLAEVATAQAELAALRAMGVLVAIDDFGTGYSSLARLRRFPVDVLKIDQSFVADLESGAEARAVVAAIVELAHAIGATVVAEGVESAEQLATLRAVGCDCASGFHLARPVPADELPWGTRSLDVRTGV